MCNVCVAGLVLEGGEEGYICEWSGRGPKHRLQMRCKGLGLEDAEFVPGSFQVKIPGQEWPREWYFTKDLAGTCGRAGMDVKWKFVPSKTKSFLQGGLTLEEFSKSLEHHPKGCPRGLKHPSVRCPQRIIKKGMATCTGPASVEYIRKNGLDVMGDPITLPCVVPEPVKVVRHKPRRIKRNKHPKVDPPA